MDLTQSDPAYAIAHSRVPTLLIHGTADRNIPLRHSMALMEVGGSHSELWVVQGVVVRLILTVLTLSEGFLIGSVRIRRLIFSSAI